MQLVDSNAAACYRKAFSLLPELTSAERRIIKNPVTARLNAAAIGLVEKSSPALQEWRRGSTFQHCNWCLDFSPNGFDQLESLFLRADQTTKLHCIRIRFLFQQNSTNDAINNLAALIINARHIGRDGPFLAKVMQLAFESRAIDLAAKHLLGSGDEIPEMVAAQMRVLPEAGTMRGTMQKEKEFQVQWTRAHLEKMSGTEAYAWMRKTSTELETEAVFEAAGRELSGVLKLIDEAGELYDELAEVMMLPLDQFKPAVLLFERRHGAENPVIPTLVTAAANIRFAQAQRDVRFAMLQAAIAIARGHMERLKTIPDPCEGGPFECRSFRGGFRLESKLKRRGQPVVSLLVGNETAVRRLFRSFRNLFESGVFLKPSGLVRPF
jgi:hypothetical protein